MRNRDDWMELELSKQLQRLKYIAATLHGNAYCDFRPRRIFIEPTNACNVNCIHCVHDGTMKRQQGFMDLGLFEKIMDDIKDWNRTTELCLFQQGEPTLHKRFAEMVQIAGTEKDFFIKANTNGAALTRELSESLVRNNLDYVVFSLDAATPATYEKIKRRPYFERVVNNILDYLEIWGDLDTGVQRNYFACDIILLQENANLHELTLFKEMFEKLPVGHIVFYELYNLMGTLEEANAKYPERFSTPREQWPCCNTPWDVMGIRWNGDAVACIYDYDSRYVIGNVKNQSVSEIWNSDAMMNFRRGLLNRRYDQIEKNGPLCSQCTIQWMKDYQIPNNYHKEIKRNEYYILRAIDRAARRHERTEILMEKHRYLKENRDAWYGELMEKARELEAIR